MDLTEKQETFLHELFGPEAKGNTTKAFDLAGYARDPRARARVLHQLADEIVARAKSFMAAASAKAVVNLDGVLDDPKALGNKHTIAAANSILDRAGIVKKEQIEFSGNVGGLFILPPKEEPHMIDVTDYAKLEAPKETQRQDQVGVQTRS